MTDSEDGAGTVSDAIKEIAPAQVIEDNIICSKSHENKSSNEVTEKKASTINRKKSLQKINPLWLDKVV